MSSIVLTGDTSGTITVSAPAVAGTRTLTLPAATGTMALTSDSPAALSTASGTAPSYSARAWVNFNGTGTVAIEASGNVSSVTDNSTGNYTINFTTEMPDVNYCVSAFGVGYASNNTAAGTNIGYCPSGTANFIPLTKTTTASRIVIGAGNSVNNYDVADVSFTVIR